MKPQNLVLEHAALFGKILGLGLAFIGVDVGLSSNLCPCSASQHSSSPMCLGSFELQSLHVKSPKSPITPSSLDENTLAPACIPKTTPFDPEKLHPFHGKKHPSLADSLITTAAKSPPVAGDPDAAPSCARALADLFSSPLRNTSEQMSPERYGLSLVLQVPNPVEYVSCCVSCYLL